MLQAPPETPSPADAQAFAAAWAARDAGLLPPATPRWLFLRWLTGQGLLLHGSRQAGIARLEPRTPFDLSPDEFSGRTGVFAASDGLWAMMYALRDPAKVGRMLNMALQREDDAGWSATQYFLSFAPRDEGTSVGRDPLSPGWVYVLSADGFEQMPPYDWPGMGRVREPHWVSPHAVAPLWSLRVTSDDFPLTVRTHGAARVDARAQADPWGFPWLEP